MRMDDALAQAFNDQIRKELASAYVYLAMAAWFEREGLPGFSKWMRVQSKEEVSHAEKLLDHMLDRDAPVALQALKAPPATFDSLRAAVELARDNEASVTQSIHAMYALATEHGDWPAQTLLHWFVTEQVEEEKIVRDVLDALSLCEQGQGELLTLDRELGARRPE